MKRFAYLILASAAGLLAAACGKEQPVEPATIGESVEVIFDVQLPDGGAPTRAISDGITATSLVVAVYNEAGAEIAALRQTGTINLTRQLTFHLVKGESYKLAFWAQAASAPYAFDPATGKVSVDYDAAKTLANDEARDAFFANDAFKVSGPINKNIYLRRPFAQLNFGSSAEDWASAVAAGTVVVKSLLTIPAGELYGTLNVLDGTVEGPVSEAVTFALAAIPAGSPSVTKDAATGEYAISQSETLKVRTEENAAEEEFVYLGMDYLLVDAVGAKALIHPVFTVWDAVGEVNTLKFSNVPVQRNYRTNVVGSLLTSAVDFNIIIDPVFAKPDKPVNVTE